jgi:hypothetical protein
MFRHSPEALLGLKQEEPSTLRAKDIINSTHLFNHEQLRPKEEK